MADIDYPASLPCPLVGSLTESQTETKVQEQGDVGAARARNRFTRALQQFSYTLRLTSEQKAVLYAFYDTSLSRGVSAFNWTHPFGGEVFEARMPARPSVKHLTRNIWIADVSIEEI